MIDPGPLRVLVTVDDDGMGRLPDLVADLRAVGLAVDTVLEHVGVVTGSIDPAAVAGVRAVLGVEDIEPERADWGF